MFQKHLSAKMFIFCEKLCVCNFFSMYLLILSDKTDEDDSASATYQAVSELPQANRDTLAYLILHLQKYETKCTILS